MTSTSWQGFCIGACASVSLIELDEQLERVAYLTEDERAAVWLYAWASRDAAARVAAPANE